MQNLYMSTKNKIVLEKFQITKFQNYFPHRSCSDYQFLKSKRALETKICRTFRFRGICNELSWEFCFLRQSFTKYFETNL